MGMLGVVSSARGFLAKVNFPHEALVYSAALKSVLDTLLAALVLIPALLVFGDRPTFQMIFYVGALGGSLLLGWTVGLLMIPLAALYGDVSRAIQIALRFGFFFTPVIFALPTGGIARRIMMVNPVTPILVTGRAWLTNSGEAMLRPFLLVIVACAVILPLSLLFYKVAVPHLIERLSA
jgi:lipopolysaccharide transport system permease protein